MTILEMKHVSKAFGGSKALSDIHFSVEEGEIHALLGENGAGKSTLMNILTGVIPADTGEISFLGRSYPSPTIRQMEEAGIAFVHQELNVINDLTVADNIFLCRELTGKLGLLRRKEQVARTKELFEDLGVDIDPNAVPTAYQNAEDNGIDRSRYTVLAGNVLDDHGFVDSLGKDYDIVVANIVAGVIVPMTPIVPRLIKKDGMYITSGIIAERAQEVMDAMEQNGFEVVYTENRKDWMVIVSKYRG